MCPLCGVSRSISHRGRRLGSRASRVAGSRRSLGRCSRCYRQGPRSTGEVLLDGEDVLQMKPGRLRAVRWTEMSIVFQGALHALNPVQRVGDQIAEAIDAHRTASNATARGRRTARDGRHSGEALGRLSAPALGWTTPARADRARARVQPARPCRRRAYDCARRDGAGPGARAPRATSAGARALDDPHHPRPLDACPTSAGARR